MSPSSPPVDPAGTPLRVLIVAPAHMVGGQAHAAQDLLRGFQGDAEVVASLQPIDPRLQGAFAWLTEAKGIRSICRPLLYARQLWRAAGRADVLHVFAAAHTAFLFGAAPAILIGRLRRRPVLLNYHDGRAGAHLQRSGAVLRWFLRRTAALVVPSAYLQDEFARHGVAAAVLPNVMDPSGFQYRERSPLPPRLVSLRSLESLYGVDNTLRAFRLLKDERPDLVLDVYGAGGVRARLEGLAAELGLGDVRFHGGIRRAEVAGVLAEGGVVVNSSRVDNQPLFVLEAFAAGTPVVTTSAGGIPWMVRHEENGLLVPVDDPAALAGQVRRLFEDPALATRLARRGRETLAPHAWPVVRAGWVAVYRSILAPRPRASSAD